MTPAALGPQVIHPICQHAILHHCYVPHLTVQEKEKTTTTTTATTEVYYKGKRAANIHTLMQLSFLPFGGALDETTAPYLELTCVLREAALTRRINLSASEEERELRIGSSEPTSTCVEASSLVSSISELTNGQGTILGSSC